MDFGDPEREKGACDIEVDRHYRNPSLRSKRFRGPRAFRTFEAFFAFWPRKNWGERKRSGRRGRRREERKRLPAKPTILKNPYAKERQSNQVSSSERDRINTTNCFSPAGKFRCSGLTLEDGCSVVSNLRDFREAFSFYWTVA